MPRHADPAKVAAQAERELWRTPLLDGEIINTCRAIRTRGHLHDVDQILTEKRRVLRSRRIDFFVGDQR